MVATCCPSGRRAVPRLLAYPNVSEGRERATIEAVAAAFGTHLIDQHSDPDHHRTAFTLLGAPGELAGVVMAGAAEAVKHVRLERHQGAHPRVGALDVAPIVYLESADRGAAGAEALVLADRLGEELSLPVFLYGELAAGRTRAELRRGGPEELERRLQSGELRPDFGPHELHPTAGAVLVASRPPLVAFNIELGPSMTLADARAIAASIREGGPEGLAGVRAIGVWLQQRGCAQVSTNVEDPLGTPLAAVVAAVARHADPVAAELVGLAPEAALRGFPADLPLRGRATIDETLARHAGTE
jgi:glutamate formiminotransferase / 5-formyltetrahydrofolate cyclo-ligase